MDFIPSHIHFASVLPSMPQITLSLLPHPSTETTFPALPNQYSGWSTSGAAQASPSMQSYLHVLYTMFVRTLDSTATVVLAASKVALKYSPFGLWTLPFLISDVCIYFAKRLKCLTYIDTNYSIRALLVSKNIYHMSPKELFSVWGKYQFH